MRIYRSAWALTLSIAVCHAQTAPDNATFLKQARAKYDAPFTRNLKSFNCAVEFDWKRHFTEAPRLGDEGTDEEIAKFIQPIRNRVTVTGKNAVASAGMTPGEIMKLPQGGMAEGLLGHAVQFSLNHWLTAANNAMLPQEETPVLVQPSTSGYKLEWKIKGSGVEMLLGHDMSLQSEAAKGSPSDRQETEFLSGPQGLVLTSFRLGEDGEFKPGNRIIFTYTYQTVGNFQLPENVSLNRESHHETWHYRLSDCDVQVAK